MLTDTISLFELSGNLRILQGEFERHRAVEGLPEA